MVVCVLIAISICLSWTKRLSRLSLAPMTSWLKQKSPQEQTAEKIKVFEIELQSTALNKKKKKQKLSECDQYDQLFSTSKRSKISPTEYDLKLLGSFHVLLHLSAFKGASASTVRAHFGCIFKATRKLFCFWDRQSIGAPGPYRLRPSKKKIPYMK